MLNEVEDSGNNSPKQKNLKNAVARSKNVDRNVGSLLGLAP